MRRDQVRSDAAWDSRRAGASGLAESQRPRGVGDGAAPGNGLRPVCQIHATRGSDSLRAPNSGVRRSLDPASGLARCTDAARSTNGVLGRPAALCGWGFWRCSLAGRRAVAFGGCARSRACPARIGLAHSAGRLSRRVWALGWPDVRTGLPRHVGAGCSWDGPAARVGPRQAGLRGECVRCVTGVPLMWGRFALRGARGLDVELRAGAASGRGTRLTRQNIHDDGAAVAAPGTEGS